MVFCEWLQETSIKEEIISKSNVAVAKIFFCQHFIGSEETIFCFCLDNGKRLILWIGGVDRTCFTDFRGGSYEARPKLVRLVVLWDWTHSALPLFLWWGTLQFLQKNNQRQKFL